MYKKVSTTLNFAEREKEVIVFWEKERVFEQTVKQSLGKPIFSLYDGPPTANGKPHIGHVLTRAMKDIIPRYKTMKGFNALRKAGWDTHGLPVELEVEKALKLEGKQDIEKFGIEPFINKCKESVWKYKSEWEDMTKRVGYWVDMNNPYITYDNNYIESVWWSLKTIHDKGLLYKGHKIVPYCPRCGTALSSHEVAQGYKDVKEKSIFVKFAVEGKENTFFLAWTTTPWTLPSNVALCVNPDEEYSTILVKDEKYILAKQLIKSLFEDFEELETVKGRKLEKMRYQPLFDYAKPKNAYFVTCDKFVTLTDGTGIVHIAPAFGEDDANVGRKYKLDFLQLIDDRGKFVEDATDLSGAFCKDGDKRIIQLLKEKNLLLKEMDYEHTYPYCWRCDTPLLYYARKSWFVAVTEIKDKLIGSNNSINWMPPSIGSGRMGNFLENLIDWGISRERYWGTPLPIWVCGKCGKVHVVGSRKELSELSGASPDTELHRPYIDEVKFACSCGGEFVRTPEVLDCWYDSGSMPFAQFHYPFENKELFEKNFPANYISEAVDQTRGWFYTLIAVSTLLFEKSPFENCIVLGHVGDKDGIKMSKHKGNVVDPWDALNKQGADAVRWYFYSSSSPWLPSRYSSEAVSEVQRKFLGTLWNTYAFFVLYADIDKYDPSKVNLKDCTLSVMDKWVLSELNTLIKNVDDWLEEFKITESARAIEEFTDSLSNWYVRRCRERFWANGQTDDKQAAYATLHHVLVSLSKVAAPFVPFIAENIYGNLVPNFYKDQPKSVHLTAFPVADENLIDKKLSEEMKWVLDIVVSGRSARNSGNIKNRQPLKNMWVVCAKLKKLSPQMIQIVKDELNVKNLEFADSLQQFAAYELKPQLKTLGPKYGAQIGLIREYLSVCDASKVVCDVREGVHAASVGEFVFELSETDLLINSVNKKGYETVTEKGLSVVLDTVLDEELLAEGLAREFVSKVQTMRKESDFVVTDHIRVFVVCQDEAKTMLEKHFDEIKKDILADEVSFGNGGKIVKQWDLNGNQVTIGIEKA